MSNSSQAKTDWKEREIGALWKKRNPKTGSVYLTGTLRFKEPTEEINVVVFPNNFKDQSKSKNPPHLFIYASTPRGEGTTSTGVRNVTQQARRQPVSRAVAASSVADPVDNSVDGENDSIL